MFLSAFVVALGQTGAAGQASSVTVDVGALPVGAVTTVTLTIHALGDARLPVFVVADRPGHVLALIGRPQSASGCALTPPREPGHVPMLLARYSCVTIDAAAATLDWAKLDQRMQYILNLFRSRQMTSDFFSQPFADAQRTVILQRKVPPGKLP